MLLGTYIMLVVIHGLIILAGHRDRQVNQWILNDALAELRRTRLRR